MKNLSTTKILEKTITSAIHAAESVCVKLSPGADRDVLLQTQGELRAMKSTVDIAVQLGVPLDSAWIELASTDTLAILKFVSEANARHTQSLEAKAKKGKKS